MSSDRPVRKHPVHGVKRIECNPTIVFVTVCTNNRKPLLANQHCHRILLQSWQQAHAWRVGRYVIMPDHIHLFAGLMDERFDLDRWIRYWKSLVTKSLNQHDFKWQPGHWDTRVRSADHYESKWGYVKHNPVRHELVEHANDWPYAGVLGQLGWD